MFERFTERARQVVVMAQEEARNNQQGYIGAEHILLGLLREEEGLAARVLASMDVTIDKAREAANAMASGRARGDEELKGRIPFTPRAKKALELALREALSLGHNYIGTEHVLLGLVRDHENTALKILNDEFNVGSEQIHNGVLRMLSGKGAPQIAKDPAERTPSGNLLKVRTLAGDEQTRDEAVQQITIQLEQLKKSEELMVLLDIAITLGRQYPDRPARTIAKAARELHG